MEVLVNELNRLKDSISDEELHHAKNVLKMNIAKDLENPCARLEEMARNYSIFGENMNFHKYAEIIDSVTSH